MGAYENKKMLGCCLSFPTSRPDIYLLHMIGVLPDMRYRSIGQQLIKKTKEISKKRGIRKIVLTYDPLESVNANLYINKQGGICRKYVTDYYRVKGSKTHSGFPADRFKVEILVNQEMKDKDFNAINPDNVVEVEIPLNFQEEKDRDIDFAIKWREKTRALFEKYITEENYIVTGFSVSKGETTGKYLLTKY